MERDDDRGTERHRVFETVKAWLRHTPLCQSKLTEKGIAGWKCTCGLESAMRRALSDPPKGEEG